MKKVNEQGMNVQLIANFPVQSSFIYATKKADESGTGAVVHGNHTVTDGIRIIHTITKSIAQNKEYTLVDKAIYLNTVRELVLTTISMALDREDNSDVKIVEAISDAHHELIRGLLEEEENQKEIIQDPVGFFVAASYKLRKDIEDGLKERLGDDE